MRIPTPEDVLPRLQELTPPSPEAQILATEHIIQADMHVASGYASFTLREFVECEDPREVYAVIANHTHPEQTVSDMLLQAENAVANFGKDLEVRTRTEEERTAFRKALIDYTIVLREKLHYQIRETIDGSERSEAVSEAVNIVLASHAAIIRREGRARLEHSALERMKQRLATNKHSRRLSRLALFGAQAVATGGLAEFLVTEEASPESQIASLQHFEFGPVVAFAAATLFTATRAGGKLLVAAATKKSLEEAGKYAPSTELEDGDAKEIEADEPLPDAITWTSRQHVSFAEQARRQTALKTEIEHFEALWGRRNPCSPVFVKRLVRSVEKSLRLAYLQEKKLPMHRKVIRNIGRLLTIGAAETVGLNKDFAEKATDEAYGSDNE